MSQVEPSKYNVLPSTNDLVGSRHPQSQIYVQEHRLNNTQHPSRLDNEHEFTPLSVDSWDPYDKENKTSNRIHGYNKSRTTQSSVSFDILCNQATVENFPDSIQKNSSLLSSRTEFAKRKHHSTNVAVNDAFSTHQAKFKRKNRAQDWLLNRKLPDIQQYENALHERYQSVHLEATRNDESIGEHRMIIENTYWGDMMTQKQPNHIRIFFQNVQGLQTSSRAPMEKWTELLTYISTHSIDIFGIAETCTNTGKHRVRHNLERIARSIFIQTSLTWSSNDFQTETAYRPGGTLLASIDSWVGRIVRVLEDPYKMGRWSGNVYQLGRQRKLYVLSMYRVCKQSQNIGLISSYQQQLLKLQQRFNQPDKWCPRKMFIKDAIEYVQSLQIQPDDYLIIMIDANESLGEDSYGMISLLERLELIDLFPRHHGRSCEIATHHCSNNKRIDLICGTPNLLPHMVNCGYIPFYDSVDTDHRGLFFDLSQSIIDGQARIQRCPQRLIGQNTSKAEVYEYKCYLQNKFSEHDVFQRAEQLYTKALNGTFETTDLCNLNILDTQITTFMLEAEEVTCSKKPPIPWSPKLHQASLIINYWKLKYRNRKSLQYDITDQLQKIEDQLTESSRRAISKASENVWLNLHKAKIDKQILQMRILEHKQDARKQLIEHEAEFRDQDFDVEKQRLAMKQETNHLFRYLAKIYGKRKSTGLTGIEVPYQDQYGQLTDDPNKAATWLKVHDPDEMIKQLLERNIKHFGQARDTVFATAPLADIFGYKGDTEAAKGLVHRQQIPLLPRGQEWQPAAKMIVDKLSDGQYLPPLNDRIEEETFWKGFKVWDEQTSTSPSGRHLGHYKALLAADGHDKEYKEGEKLNPSNQLKEVHFHIALAATLSGNTLNRWCNSSTMMIEKIPGQPRIHKLRVIHIFEADYNLMLKLLWSRKLVWHAHKHSRLNEAQAGSRPDHRCIDVVLRKTMNYLYATLTRTPLITIDNDAKACYDRILCNLAMLASKYFGMTTAACSFHAKTLEQMIFRIRTAAGDSVETYSHTIDTPIHGTGQGSCASPCLWLLLSSLLLDCYEKQAVGMTLHDVMGREPVKKAGAESFVDDVALFINLASFLFEHRHFTQDIKELILQLISYAKQDINLWQALLRASGGKLELTKCFWYLLWWSCNHMGDYAPMTLDEFREQGFADLLDIKEEEGWESISLEMKDVEEAHRTLGAYKNMVGEESKQYDVLLEKSNSFAVSTKLGQLSRFQARRAFTSIYIPSMTYSLVSANLSRAELKAIQSKAIQAFLPAMGYERTFPHAVAFASRTAGGLNIGDLYTECGIAKVGSVLAHTRAQTGLGQIMRTNINWLQITAGISTPILANHQTIKYLPTNWFIHLQEFLQQINSKIEIRGLWQPKVERVGDSLLMDKISQLNLPTREIRICNNWRLYFQALTLSDIVTADGKMIHDYYWKVSQAVNDKYVRHRRSKLNWPIQQRPDRQTFHYWEKCINLAFHLHNNQQLPLGLGDWLLSPQQSANEWEFYYVTYPDTLLRNTFSSEYDVHNLDNQFNRYSTTLRFEMVPDDRISNIPDKSFPVNPVLEYNTFRVRQTQYHCPWTTNSVNAPPQDFEQHITTLDPWKQQILMHWETTSLDSLLEFLSGSTNILIASDGAFDQEKGTGSFGAVIGDESNIYAKIMGSAPGRPDIHCSFRSEMYGVLAICALLNEITTYHHLQGHQYGPREVDRTTLRFYIDSKSVIDRISKHRGAPVPLGHVLQSDMDLELQILAELSSLERKGYRIPKFQHVKAHQDKIKDWGHLSREEKLNVYADDLATSFNHSDYIRQQYYPPSMVQSSLYLESEAITSKYRECIRHAFHLPALRTYMQNKWDWSANTMDEIWWEPHGNALKRLSHSDRQKVQKFNYYHLPTNHRLSKFQQSVENRCVDCESWDENDDHVIQCNHQNRLEAKQLWEADVHHYLSEEHTPTLLGHVILAGFHHWIYNKPIPDLLSIVPEATPELVMAFQAQSLIGWNHFIRGRLSVHWKDIIVGHLAGTKTKTVRTSNEWATGLVISLWHGVLILWDMRNRSAHGPNLTSQSILAKQRLLKEAEILLDIVDQHQHFEIEWFKKPLEELEKYSVISLKAWVRNARTVVRLHKLVKRKNLKEEEAERDGLSNVNSVDLLEEMEDMTVVVDH